MKIDGEFYEIDGRAGARQEAQARHRRGGGPRRRAAGYGRALAESLETALELADGIAVIEFADEQGREGRAAPAHLLLEIRLSGLRLHDPGGRTAAVLVQQSVRRVPGLRRPRPRDGDRPDAGRARRDADLAWRRHCALGAVHLALLRPDAGGIAASITASSSTDALEGPARKGAGRDPLRLRRGADALRL